MNCYLARKLYLFAFLSVNVSFVLADDAKISVPGVKIDGDSVQLPGILIDSDGVKMPGVEVDNSGIKAPGVEIDSSGIKTPEVEINSSGGVKFGTAENQGQSAEKFAQTQSGQGASFIDSDSSRSDFSGKNLADATFTGGDFSRTNFSGTDLAGAVFTNVDLSRVNFSSANLAGAVFIDVELSRAEFSGACMLGASITGGNLSRTTWGGAIITGMKRVEGDYSRADLSGALDGPADCSSLGFQTSSVRSNTSTVTNETVEIVKTRKFKQATEITQALERKDSRVDLTVNFATDSDQIVAEAHSQVLEIASALKSDSLQGIELLVEGHTDHDGSDDYNIDLSYRRAVTVVNTLSEMYGVSSSRLKVKGYGESQPVASNQSESGKALNRRVTLVRLN